MRVELPLLSRNRLNQFEMGLLSLAPLPADCSTHHGLHCFQSLAPYPLLRAWANFQFILYHYGSRLFGDWRYTSETTYAWRRVAFRVSLSSTTSICTARSNGDGFVGKSAAANKVGRLVSVFPVLIFTTRGLSQRVKVYGVQWRTQTGKGSGDLQIDRLQLGNVDWV